MTKYVIIGNSAAGVSAAETIRQLDAAGHITIIDAENTPAYTRCLLPRYLDGSRTTEGLRLRSPDFYDRLHLNTYLGCRAEGVDPAAKMVHLEDGRHLAYDRLLVATGGSTAFPPLPGIAAKRVYGLRNLEDAGRILEQARRARRAVIIGAGLVGLEAAWALRRCGLEVTVVEKLPQILPQQFDVPAAAILQQEMQRADIKFILGTGIKEVTAPTLWNRGRRNVVLENGDRLPTELIIVATGTRPNTTLLKGTGVRINQGIAVDKHMATEAPDIFAAGDVVETRDVVTGRIGLTPIWPNAVAQGRVAAYNMAGQVRAYGGMIGMQNTVTFRNVTAVAAGLAQAEDGDYELCTDYRPGQNHYKKLVLHDDIIVGLIMVGDIRQAGVYAALMRSRCNVARFKTKLLQADFGYGRVFCA